jgi:hypothetical protein
VETNQVLGSAPSGSAVQVTPTSPEILPAEIPEGRMGATAGAVGNSALLPMIVIYFHCSTIPIRKIKLTASKMSRAALATVDSGKRVPRERRGDVSALGGCTSVGVGTGKGTGSCKSGEDESRDDFELHIVFFCSCNADY